MKTRMTLLGVALLAGAGLALIACAGPPATPPAEAPAALANPEEAAIRERHDAFVKAYNAADARALGDLFADDAEVIDSSGEATRGRSEIAAMYAESFKGAKGLKLESTAGSIRLITADVARVEG